ncbi:cytochrome [Paracoccus aestuarii]|uniref:Cytochrome n=1 Tax=Paracoccus aestuarii TaxID=453842 RepID=A0A419A361_9RHOB|nr:cytochrome b/b6 domain-containing protein [Paracoccus aestuarii]RJL07550.1 cytochrome [Paracoccus aestuarii]WCQ99031.1 cytochrome b/b6 domain-containing protein [Paracoccus aestuarii]
MRHNTATCYGSVARTLHWLTALLIIANIGLGLWAVYLPLDAMALKVQVFSLHKTLGITALAVALVRILWAFGQTRPAPVHPDRRAETLAAEAVHWTLYAAMVLVPVTGWVEHAATEGYAPILWPLGQGLPLVPKSPALAMTMASVHTALAFLLIGSILLHVAGALKHALIDRDGVLARMTRGRPAGPGVAAGHAGPALVAVLVIAAAGGLGWATRPGDAAPSDRLAQAVSDWQVIDGRLAFSVRQMGSEVQGGFEDWTAAITFDPDSGTGRVDVAINMDSVTIGTVTQQAKGADFFDVDAHPVARFQGEIRPDGAAHLAEGVLELRGASMPVSLPFDLQIDPDGVARMQGATVLDRRDWQIGQGYGDESTVGFAVDLVVELRAQR